VTLKWIPARSCQRLASKAQRSFARTLWTCPHTLSGEVEELIQIALSSRCQDLTVESDLLWV